MPGVRLVQDWPKGGVPSCPEIRDQLSFGRDSRRVAGFGDQGQELVRGALAWISDNLHIWAPLADSKEMFQIPATPNNDGVDV